jgi:hypothetical protein
MAQLNTISFEPFVRGGSSTTSLSEPRVNDASLVLRKKATLLVSLPPSSPDAPSSPPRIMSDEKREKVDDEKGVPPPSYERGTEDVLPEGSTDPVYQAKARILNDAIQEIGMGKYQWALFVVTGFGTCLCFVFRSYS